MSAINTLKINGTTYDIEVANIDSAPTANSTNPVTSGALKTALDGKKNTQSAVSDPTASGTALSFIDTISQNEQGVIAATKKSVTVDATPTENSTNPVQSGGVEAALDNKQDKLTLPLAILQGGTGADNLSRFMGRETGFTYASVNSGDANNYINEAHYFVFNMANTPANYGFLDVEKAGCEGFSPTGAKPIIIQKFTHWFFPDRKWIRNKKGDEGWTQWIYLSVIGLSGIAILVIGDTAETAVAPGAYAYIRDNSHGLADGLYRNKSSSAFPTSGGTADSTVFEAVPGGGLNILNNNKQDKLTLPLAILQGGTGSTTAELARANLGCRAITADMGTVTGTGSAVTVTKTVTGVTDKMTVDRIEFSVHNTVLGNWTVTTATDSVTFSAPISGSTTVKIKLSDNTDVTGM